MEQRFDLLAKSVAGATTRREAISRLGRGLTLGVLAFLGLGAGGPGDCAPCCATQCVTNFSGQDIGECMQLCLGTGRVDGGAPCMCECAPDETCLPI